MMPTESTAPSPASQPEDSRLAKLLEEMIAEQGVANTATFERLLGSGTDLWADDAEFDAFLQHVQAIRTEAP
jgi:hypothetical protein